MKIYKSKIDWWLVVVVFTPFLFGVYQAVREQRYGLGFLFLAILVLIYYYFKSMKYVIKDTILQVGNVKIEISTIRKVYKTNSILSSPALSLDRIAVCYNNYDEIIISPKNKENFINDLVLQNPEIVVVL